MLQLARFRSSRLPAAVALLVLGCAPSSDAGPPPVSLDVRVDVGAVVRRVAVQISGTDIEAGPSVVLEIADEVASGNVPVTQGAGRTLHIVAYDGRGDETHSGSVSMDITTRETPAVAVVLESATDDRPMTAIVGSFMVSVYPAAVEAEAGDTVRIRAAVLDAYDDTLHVGVRWRSLGPARAVVDSTGLVTVVAPGTVPIVASVAGVGAAATLTASVRDGR